MGVLSETLGDRGVNGFMVGLLLGISTINFINNVGGMVLDHVFGVATSAWSWKIFWGQIILYFVAIIVAVLIRRRVAK